MVVFKYITLQQSHACFLAVCLPTQESESLSPSCLTIFMLLAVTLQTSSPRVRDSQSDMLTCVTGGGVLYLYLYLYLYRASVFGIRKGLNVTMQGIDRSNGTDIYTKMLHVWVKMQLKTVGLHGRCCVCSWYVGMQTLYLQQHGSETIKNSDRRNLHLVLGIPDLTRYNRWYRSTETGDGCSGAVEGD